MKTLGGFIRKRRRELGLFGREVVAAVLPARWAGKLNVLAALSYE